MSFLNCLGLLLLSLSWMWMLPIYKSPGNLWLSMILLGLVLLSFPPKSMRLVTDYIHPPGGGGPSSRFKGEASLHHRDAAGSFGRLPGIAALLLVPFLLAVFTLPKPLIYGPIVLSLATIAGVLVGEGRGRFRPLTGCILGGAVLTVQGIILPLLAVFSAHFHTIPVFGYILFPFVHLFDPSAVLEGGRIFVSSVEEIFGFGVSFEKLALVPMALFFAAVIVARIFIGDALSSLGRLILVFILYGAVRFIFVLFAVVILNDEALFWIPLAILISLVPLALVIVWAVPYGAPLQAAPGKNSAKERGGVPVSGTVLITVAFFLLVGSLVFHDPGGMKRGRVLFDEKYSDWEWSTKVYDREWYGLKSGYNYYSLAEYINFHYDLDRGLEAFTPEYLARYDVVVIKTPTQAFTKEEIDALEDFVKNGGGLFLVGDHTNVFGTSTNLNPVAARFGMRFNYDSTYQLESMALSYYVPPPLVAHPSVLHVPEFFFATSCTMDSPLFGENVITAYALRSIMLDYSRRSYFPSKDEREYNFGFLIQMAGVKAGKGRVLGHTDSTVFSNFFMFIPGKPECFLGALDWLNRVNRWHHLNLVFFILGLIAAVLGGRCLKGAGRLQAGGAVLFSLVLALVLSLHFFNALKKSSYPPLRPKREMRTIAFDQDPSLQEMPLKSLVHNKNLSLHTFYVWTQRLGLVPSLHPTMKEALEASPIAVVANPSRSISIDEVDAVVDFVRKGGNLLLIVDPANRRSSAEEFLGIFRMGVEKAAADTTEIINIKGERICNAFNAGTLHGGIPLLTLPGGRTTFAYEKLGRGRFFAFADFTLFSQAVMGPTSAMPNRMQREVYELEYQILEILMGNREPTDIKPYMGSENPVGSG